ncbi:MAG: peroxiredoxin Q/BCP [Bradymonadia bacterium]|jgi:peroxiredoxin Q/BCP
MSAEATPPTLEIGQPAPDFTLPSDTDGDVQLSALRGTPVVLYFYPKDNTPGCTTEACDFRDRMDRVKAAGATVLGVSPDSLRKHGNFRTKFDLNFPLLVDAEKAVNIAYGVWREKKNYGRTYMGTVRSTFLIDAEGVIRQIWDKVRVKGHADAVIEALEAL